MRVDRSIPLLVLGLGNVLCADDGLGVAAVERLREGYEPAEGTLVLDGGTLGLSLLPYLEDARNAILVDAIRDDAAPGSLVRLEGEDVAPAVAARLSVHQIGVVDLLDGARWLGRTPERLVLHGIVPESIDLSVVRSACVERSLPELVRRVAEEAGALGFPFRPLLRHEPRPETSFRAGARALGL